MGTSQAAAAILADALDLGPDIDRAGISVGASYPKDTVLVGLREEFCSDVLSPSAAMSSGCTAARCCAGREAGMPSKRSPTCLR